jgi:hypothetical protein
LKKLFNKFVDWIIATCFTVVIVEKKTVTPTLCDYVILNSDGTVYRGGDDEN